MTAGPWIPRAIAAILLLALACGASADTAAQNIPPQPDFAYNVTSGTAPLWVQFTDTSAGAPTSWAWDFDNNGIIDSREKDPVCVYRLPGTYSVTLWATNSFRTETVTMTDIITVANPGPVPVVVANATSGLPPLAVQFADNATAQGVTAWAWDFDNNGVIDSTGRNPVCVYNLTGNYTVSLLATNSSGTNTTILEKFITVEDPLPIARFTANTTFGGLPLTVRLYDNSTGANITARAWDFNNDGTVDSTEKDPVCVYTTAGDYTVRLTVTNAYGTNTTSVPAFVTVTNGAAVDFTANVTSGLAPLWVQFADNTTAKDITGWAWDFDNDTVIDSTERNPACVYKKPGNYTVNLWITNPYGVEAISAIDFITARSSATPDFSANETAGITPFAVRFTDNSTGENIASRAWDFDNDGTIDSTEKDPVCVYTASGDYAVNLTVTDARGTATKLMPAFIAVTDGRPRARFAVNTTWGYAPLTIQFRDTSVGTNISAWAWDFNGDSTVDSTEKTPFCTYTRPGLYTVSLATTNEYGTNTTVKTGFITVD